MSLNEQHEILSLQRKQEISNGTLPEWYITPGYQLLTKRYLDRGETLLDRMSCIAEILARFVPYPVGKKRRREFEKRWQDRFFSLMWEGILSPATPVLANVGRPHKGMSVSCSGQFVEDSVDSFFSNLRETALLSKNNFGTSADFSSIRARGSKTSAGGKASGPVPVMEQFFATASMVSQGGNREGSGAAYLDIEHPDWWEAAYSLEMNPDGKNFGWTIRDTFTAKLINRDPEALRRLKKACYLKAKTGKGYFFFADKANRARPSFYDKEIVASNLCTEIMLHSSRHYSFSCVLSSMNLSKWDKDSWTVGANPNKEGYLEDPSQLGHIQASLVFLDCLCSYFIKESFIRPGMEKVRASTLAGRAVGLGVMGFGTYLQSKETPFESLESHLLSCTAAKAMQSSTEEASRGLALIGGSPEWCRGTGLRNTHRTASAPTKSTALLMGGVSESWFPDPAMVFEAKTAGGGVYRVVPNVIRKMKERGVYNEETIKDIEKNSGSVQHVGWLGEDEKKVFKTAYEIDQSVIARMASARQPFICQGQSINLYFPAGFEPSDMMRVLSDMILDPNCLSQYYIHSEPGAKIGEKVKDECVACSG